ncbi:hypothetical protein RPW61_22705 [Citrobacter freundii]|uniref:hypothetical protein n=1 Tax=Citrobacter freundii TaxID=546 RepID=UPI0028E15515|nr:hypothetical protein [Citrobacter freundii]MDT9381202.1 hypothetical protein [Citrobacter freundii]
MNILIAVLVCAALPWLFTLIWSFIYWDFRNCWDARRDSRESVIFAVIGVVFMAVNGGLQ